MTIAVTQRPRWTRPFAIGLPLAWLLVFILLPGLGLLLISVTQEGTGLGAAGSLLTFAPDGTPQINATTQHYQTIISDDLYLMALLNTLRIAAVSSIIALILGYPIAYMIARAGTEIRVLLLVLVALPFWTSFLIRVYAWVGLLNSNGIINNVLLGLGIISQPLPLLHTELAVHIGIVYSYLPFMILPIYAVLERLDWNLLDAASDLGARPISAFLRVTLPLSMPGVAAGLLLVFIPTLGEFVIPDLLGGPETLMLGKIIWIEFFNNRDWPLASALGIVLLGLVLLLISAAHRRAAPPSVV